jgi:hypothetical protein
MGFLQAAAVITVRVGVQRLPEALAAMPRASAEL